MGILDILNPANISAALPADFTTKLGENIALGAASTVLLNGLKSQGGQDALDPMHLFHKDGSTGSTMTTTVGATITAAAFSSLPQADKDALLKQGYHIV